MQPPRLVADADIPWVGELFGEHYRLELLPTDQINRAAVRRADMLLVRTLTPVNGELLQGAAVRFVGTASGGTDHLDADFLHTADICVADGAGGNCRAVVEYVLAVIAAFIALRQQQGAPDTHVNIKGLSLGLIGCGRIGGALRSLCSALGMRVHAFDPWREDCTGTDLQRAASCQILSLHTPLIDEPPAPTRHLITPAVLQSLPHRPELLINTARGELLSADFVTDVAGILPDMRLALDVWYGEPEVDPMQVAACWLTGAHRAGHSLEGRRGCVYQVACRAAEFWNLPAPKLPVLPALPPLPADNEMQRQTQSSGLPLNLLQQQVDLAQTHADMSRVAQAAGSTNIAGPAKAAQMFRRLRAGAVRRREFAAQPICTAALSGETRERLSLLGFPQTP